MTDRLVLMMAGGTGGHVFPALSVAEELRHRGFVIEWLGSQRGIENRLVPEAGIALHTLSVHGLRGGGLAGKLLAPFMLARTVWSAVRLILQLRPVLAVGFGGYASGPGGLAARLCGVPLVLHEQNARPGLTNKVLSRFASRTLQAFPGAFANAEVVGNPVRNVIAQLPTPEQRLAGHEGAIRILVVGGSQGALALNTRLPTLLAEWLGERRTQVVIRHQCGRGRREEVLSSYDGTGLDVQVSEFIDDMAEAYEWADLMICRSGALTVSEVAAAGVAAVFVPLPNAVDDHQTLNARWLADAAAARLLPQKEMDLQGLALVLEGLLERGTLQEMSLRARSHAVPESAQRVADICEEVLRG